MNSLVVGSVVPSLTVECVGEDRMKTMAALLRDPYPIHWDPHAVQAAGHGDRPVNQGPLNVAYIANMLMAWAGESAIRRLSVNFHARVLAGDTVVASGEITAITECGSDEIATCAVRLTRDEELIITGTAEVAIRAQPVPTDETRVGAPERPMPFDEGPAPGGSPVDR